MAQTTGSLRQNPHLGSLVRRSWPFWVGYTTVVWSLLYGTLGLYWVFDGRGFPFGENDPHAETSLLSHVRVATAAPLIAVLGLIGTVVALVMVRAPRPAYRRLLLSFAWTTALVLLFIIPDVRVLIAVAYAPIVLIGAPFGWPPVDYTAVALPWSVVNQFICIAGGFAWTVTAVIYQRQTRGACPYCGRQETGAPIWSSPAAAARWGRWAVAIAAVVPLFYAGIRWAWALGIPLGITTEILQELQTSGLWLAGAALATVATGGAVLTLGLIQPWGEVFPTWIPFLAGRRVPLSLAIVPAAFVSCILFSAGLTAISMRWSDFADGTWLANPLMWFPVWGLALGAATLAYYVRRRGQCRWCERG